MMYAHTGVSVLVGAIILINRWNINIQHILGGVGSGCSPEVTQMSWG